MKQTVVALDDEPLALVLIEKYLELIPNWELINSFTDSRKALEFVEHNEIDLILSDINMPDMTGLQFVNELSDSRPLVIFITAYKEHALQSYDLDVIDYLVKPVSFDRFEHALQKAQEWLKGTSRDVEPIKQQPQKKELLVHSEYQLKRIDIDDILYIQSMGDYVRIFLSENRNPIMTLERIKNLTEKLINHGFIRIHRSYLINKNKVESVSKTKLKIDDSWLPISQSYQNDVQMIFGIS